MTAPPPRPVAPPQGKPRTPAGRRFLGWFSAGAGVALVVAIAALVLLVRQTTLGGNDRDGEAAGPPDRYSTLTALAPCAYLDRAAARDLAGAGEPDGSRERADTVASCAWRADDARDTPSPAVEVELHENRHARHGSRKATAAFAARRRDLEENTPPGRSVRPVRDLGDEVVRAFGPDEDSLLELHARRANFTIEITISGDQKESTANRRDIAAAARGLAEHPLEKLG